MKPFSEIEALITAEVAPEAVKEAQPDAAQPWLAIAPEHLLAVANFLKTHKDLWFDQLASISGVDRGPEANQMEVVYHLWSIPHQHGLVLRCRLPRNPQAQGMDAATPAEEAEAMEKVPSPQPPADRTLQPEEMPSLPSVSSVWRAADWHERETFDLMGIYFEGHPDLRRMFLEDDWPGHPLRKDYQEPEQYHGVRVPN